MEPGDTLKIESLDNQWRDKDSVMLHACFQLLKDAVEKEKILLGDTDWNANEKHQFAKNEIQELYNWWIEYKESSTPDEKAYSNENKMLKRLIDIRWALWT